MPYQSSFVKQQTHIENKRLFNLVEVAIHSEFLYIHNYITRHLKVVGNIVSNCTVIGGVLSDGTTLEAPEAAVQMIQDVMPLCPVPRLLLGIHWPHNKLNAGSYTCFAP